MKAAVFYGKQDLRVTDLPIPQPKAGEVVIRVKACGVCGTDRHIYEGDEGAAATPSGTVLGHEFSGEIVALGEGVTAFAVGERVCVDPNKLCNQCAYCKNALGHFCTDMVGIGTTVHGGFAEYCAAPVSQLYRIPDGTTFEQAAMTEPVACCLHGMDMCDIAAGDTVLIIGAGMIGLIMVQLAKLRGATNIIVSEPVADKRAHAAQLGADVCIDPTQEDVAAVLRAQGVERVATVIECVGRPATMEQAIALAGKKSTVMFFGLSKPDEEIRVKPFELFKKEIVLKSSFINPYTMQRALELIASGRVDVSSMIYAVKPVEELSGILGDGATFAQGKYIIKV